MSPAMIGAWIGAGAGLLSFAAIRYVAHRVETERTSQDPRRTAGVLRLVAFVDLMLFPLAGYFIGPMVLEA